MIRWRPILLIAAVSIIFVMLGVALLDNKAEIVLRSDQPDMDNATITVTLKDFTYTNTNAENARLWDVQAAAARHYRDQNRFYASGGQVYRLCGQNGTLDTATRDMYIQGGAVGSMPDNTTIETDWFRYDHARRIITTDARIRIMRPGFVMNGVGMQVTLDNQTLVIRNQVTAQGLQ